MMRLNSVAKPLTYYLFWGIGSMRALVALARKLAAAVDFLAFPRCEL